MSRFVPVVGLLVLLSSCTFGVDGAEPSGASGGDLAQADRGWADGLDVSVNGPVPAIVVDQFGYRTGADKVAVLRSAGTGYDAGAPYRPGAEIVVVDAASGQVAFTERAVPWQSGKEDVASGDHAWWFDFSEFDRPGHYFIEDRASSIRSGTFVIGDDVYRDVFRQALRTFFLQRAGQDKPGALVGADWADSASHLGRDQDPQARSWLRPDDPHSTRDLRGGWYDAGDYNKYTAWHASYVIGLLDIYREHPGLVGDDLAIQESGNGVSDLLDEIVWGLDWLERMQVDDGSVLCIEGLDSASPPSRATGPSYYGPATTNATLKAAAAFAHAATVLAGSGVPTLAERADDLTRRAESAWKWASAHPREEFRNNEDASDSSGLGGGQQETDDRGRADAALEAATHLYERTGDAKYRDHVESAFAQYLPPGSQSQWTVRRQETLLHYAALPGVSPSVASRIRADYLAALQSGDPFLPAVATASDPYRAPLAQYTWGSNQSKALMGRMFALASLHGFDDVAGDASAAAEDYLHYLHGANPLGLVYLTNMAQFGAEHSAWTMYHHWYARGTRWEHTSPLTPGPPPGFLVGGPNPDYEVDRCCADDPACGGADEAAACGAALSPPRRQPPMKAYLQFNDGWPANSWQVSENSNGYQVAYLQLLSSFVP